MQTNLNNLIAIFDDMTSDGWDLNSSLKYGFYFNDDSKDKLKNVFEELGEKNYVMEDIYQLDGDSKWILHVSKIDALTPEKLHRRNIAFNELANHCQIELYDGWDVEQIPQ
jgi:hypothetical protein